MFGFFEPREMLRSFAARGMYCLKISLNRVHAPRGKLNVWDKQKMAHIIEGDVELRFHNRFIQSKLNIPLDDMSRYLLVSNELLFVEPLHVQGS